MLLDLKRIYITRCWEFLTAGDLGKITIRFVDENNQELKHEVTKYGTVGEKFEFSADPIYGYRVIDNKPITGTYTKEGAVYVFTYELYTDKAALNNEVTNALKEKIISMKHLVNIKQH